MQNWDPWWDDKLFKHTTYSKGAIIHTLDLPSQYCQYPSPGMKTWDPAANVWTTEVNGDLFGAPQQRRDGQLYSRCDDVSVYTGPSGSTGPQKKRRGYIAKEDSEVSSDVNATHLIRSDYGPTRPRSLSHRRATSGDYLDSRVFDLLPCTNDDYDECLYKDCGDPDWPPVPDEDLAETTTTTSNTAPTATTAATATTADADSKCPGTSGDWITPEQAQDVYQEYCSGLTIGQDTAYQEGSAVAYVSIGEEPGFACESKPTISEDLCLQLFSDLVSYCASQRGNKIYDIGDTYDTCTAYGISVQ